MSAKDGSGKSRGGEGGGCDEDEAPAEDCGEESSDAAAAAAFGIPSARFSASWSEIPQLGRHRPWMPVEVASQLDAIASDIEQFAAEASQSTDAERLRVFAERVKRARDDIHDCVARIVRNEEHRRFNPQLRGYGALLQPTPDSSSSSLAAGKPAKQSSRSARKGGCGGGRRKPQPAKAAAAAEPPASAPAAAMAATVGGSGDVLSVESVLAEPVPLREPKKGGPLSGAQ